MTRTRYATPEALRAALDARLLTQQHSTGRDPNWLRRRLALVRLLVRLTDHAPHAWILKGGLAVELRRPGRARSTRDVDLVLRPGLVADPCQATAVREALLDALAIDVDSDGLVYSLGRPARFRHDAYGQPAWRFPVEAALAGRSFAHARLDLVAQPDEISGVEQRELPDLLGFAGIPSRTIWVTDLRQQFAEKLHALTHTYSTGESSRVKDLIDLVLLIEDGVPADADLVSVARHLFGVRHEQPVPCELGPVPSSWQEPFPVLAAEVGLSTTSHDEARALVAAHWQRAVAHSPGR